jgi:hypothetical protein
VEVGVKVGEGVMVGVRVGDGDGGSGVSLGPAVDGTVALGGTVALMTKFWLAGQVTGISAGITMGPLQAARTPIRINAKRAWPIFIVPLSESESCPYFIPIVVVFCSRGT